MDVAASCVVGVSETLVGFPFLTAKVLMQNNRKWFGLPIKRYYQGVKYPLFSSIGFNMIVFPLKERFYPYTNSYWTSGALAGLCVAPQMFFIDTYTIRRQTNQNVSLQMFKKSKGFGTTVARESVALSTYFGVYHKVRENHNSFFAGGVAGLANWTTSFPLDTVRTRQIAQRCTIIEAAKQRKFWRGFPIAAVRAVIVNAVSFTVFEKTLGYLT